MSTLLGRQLAFHTLAYAPMELRVCVCVCKQDERATFGPGRGGGGRRVSGCVLGKERERDLQERRARVFI